MKGGKNETIGERTLENEKKDNLFLLTLLLTKTQNHETLLQVSDTSAIIDSPGGPAGKPRAADAHRG